MFRNNKSRVDIKEYLKEMKLSQSAMVSRNSSQESDQRRNQDHFTSQSGQKRDSRSFTNYDDKEGRQIFHTPPTQNLSDGYYSQGRQQNVSQPITNERNEANIPFKIENPLNSGLPQNTFQQNHPIQNQIPPYPYYPPYVQYDPKTSGNNQYHLPFFGLPETAQQGKCQQGQQFQMPTYPYMWYPQYPPVSAEQTKKTIPKQEQSKPQKTQKPQKPQKPQRRQKKDEKQSPKKIQKRNRTPSQNVKEKRNSYETPQPKTKNPQNSLLDQLNPLKEAIREHTRKSHVPPYKPQVFRSQFSNDLIPNNIKRLTKILKPLDDLIKQISNLEKTSKSLHQTFEEMNRTLQITKNTIMFTEEFDSNVCDFSYSEQSGMEDD